VLEERLLTGPRSASWLVLVCIQSFFETIAAYQSFWKRAFDCFGCTNPGLGLARF
jgi:hypothetical protein